MIVAPLARVPNFYLVHVNSKVLVSFDLNHHFMGIGPIKIEHKDFQPVDWSLHLFNVVSRWQGHPRLFSSACLTAICSTVSQITTGASHFGSGHLNSSKFRPLTTRIVKRTKEPFHTRLHWMHFQFDRIWRFIARLAAAWFLSFRFNSSYARPDVGPTRG
jgi:hypothetical protein